MGLPRRLAVLTALLAILLVLGATEVALSWSDRTRREDFRMETVALANTLASLLIRTAPTGDRNALTVALEGWSKHRITESQAIVYLREAPNSQQLVAGAASDSAYLRPPDQIAYDVWRSGQPAVRLQQGDSPAWQVFLPLASPPLASPPLAKSLSTRTPAARSPLAKSRRAVAPYGVLEVRVSIQRLEDWARQERTRAYLLAGLSAILVSLGVAMLTAYWVGRPLAAIGGAMTAAHSGAGGAPAAPEIGPPEFRALARRYNELVEALASREQESTARAHLLNLEERARNFDRLALMHETAASFAHEIGTPLNTMSGHLQLLRDDLATAGDGRGAERVRLLLGQVDRVAGIVQAALARGAWPEPLIAPADLTEIASRILQFLEPSFNDAGVTASLVTNNGARRAPMVKALCDPAMVEQILLNLLKNAVEAIGPGSAIRVMTGRTADAVYIEVEDDGPGLTPAAEALLFRPFATTKMGVGTGLGLAVSRRLARMLRGDLVHLPAKRGARWRLTLPIAPAVEPA